ncbi:MAG TPA: hypothetical protein VGJ07_13905 [Rugosimonospora sp.]
MHELLLDVREALTIWLGLVALTALVCVVLSLTSKRGRERRAARRAARSRGAAMRLARQARQRAAVAADRGAVAGTTTNPPSGNRAAPTPGRRNRGALRPVPETVTQTAGDQLADSVTELSRYAGEVAVAASRAAVTAQRRRQEWCAVLNAQEAAWRAYETADRAARRVIEAAAFPLPDADSTLTVEEARRRETYLQRAATGAYHRGELTIEQLSAAMMHRNGWDSSRHPFEQDLVIRCAGRIRLLHTYRLVSDIERAAWHQAEMAAAAHRSLNEEAFAAAMRAHRAQHPLPEGPRRRPPTPAGQGRTARPPVVARGRVAVQLVGRSVTSP